MLPLATALGFALMAGLNLPLAACLVAVSVRLDLAGFGTTFPTLAPLGTTTFLIVAASCAVVEFILDRIPRLDSLWDIPNLIIRPAGAAIGTYLLVSQNLTIAIIAAFAAAAIALSVHLAKAAFRARLNRAGGVSKNVFAANAEDALAIGTAAFITYLPHLSFTLTVPSIALALYLAPMSLVTLRAKN